MEIWGEGRVRGRDGWGSTDHQKKKSPFGPIKLFKTKIGKKVSDFSHVRLACLGLVSLSYGVVVLVSAGPFV